MTVLPVTLLPCYLVTVLPLILLLCYLVTLLPLNLVTRLRELVSDRKIVLRKAVVTIKAD